MVGPLEVLRSCRKISEETWVLSGGKSAFKALQKILSKTPVLENLDWLKECFVETDASQYGVRAVLFQKEGERTVYINFVAKAFNKAQQNYSAIKHELLAGLFAMEKWRLLLLHRKFIWGLDN